MENKAKKFIIPDIQDDDDDEIGKGGAPHYFQAGKISEEGKGKKNDADSIEGKSLETSGASNDMKMATKNLIKLSHNPNYGEQQNTKFESAFKNLRSSKFYECSENVDNPSVSTRKPPEYVSKATGSILVNSRQRGNPLLKSIRNVPWEFEEIEPDYVIGKTACALFLSMRYHNLFPNYIHERLKSLGKSYNLRVLLVQVDVLEPTHPLKDLSVIAILADCTLMVAWSAEEAGCYLETYKMFENKSADLIKEKQGNDNYSQLIDCLTTVRSINKTDAMVLLSTFGTLEKIIQASVADLSMCPGMGPLKAKRLYDAFRKPLKNERKGKT